LSVGFDPDDVEARCVSAAIDFAGRKGLGSAEKEFAGGVEKLDAVDELGVEG
jgi:hypothetical protein